MAAGGSVQQAAIRLGLPDTQTAHYRCYSIVGDTHAWPGSAVTRTSSRWVEGGKPELADRKRQNASIILWARLAGSEHVFAPHSNRDQQPAHLRNA